MLFQSVIIHFESRWVWFRCDHTSKPPVLIIMLLSVITIFSRQRYWFLLLLTLALNIFIIIDPTVALRNNLAFINSSDPRFGGNVVPFPFFHRNNLLFLIVILLGILHSFFSIWMVLEYFILNWPNFVLPEFLYKVFFLPKALHRFRLISK